jgi:hypothetical protein
MTDFFNLQSGPFCDISASMWANLRARLVLSNIHKKPAKQFPPSVKKVMTI